MIWTKFSDSSPTKPGDYWIYRNRNGNMSRIFMTTLYKKCGWRINLKHEYVNPYPEWTHWMEIQKPKPPSDKGSQPHE